MRPGLASPHRPFLVLALLATLGGCGGKVDIQDPTAQPRATSIVLSTTAHTLTALGATIQLTAVVKDQHDATMTTTITWSTSESSIALVDAGVVTAVANGTATITATVGSVSATATITVQQVAATLTLSPTTDTLAAIGATVQLTATRRDGRGHALPPQAAAAFNWSSDAVTVATVAASGLVTATGPGSARISAQIGTLSAVATILVDDFGDLGVGWIHRSPEIDFVQGSTNPTRDGWPAIGQAITWDAKVKNWSAFARSGVPYRWLLDGAVVAAGQVNMPAQSYVTVSLPSTWSFQRRRLAFELDHTNQVPESEERNNRVEIFTDAITVGLYVEQSLYDHFARNQFRLGIGSNSWEDWAQRQVAAWNLMFENARYPDTPNGVLDRIRLDKITTVPDGGLPLGPGGATNLPNFHDRTVDLQWGFPASLLPMYSDFTTLSGPDGSPYNPFDFEGSLIHELGHARYLIDVYGFNVTDGVLPPGGGIINGDQITITEGGQLVAGSPYMPIQAWDVVLYTPMPGLMNGPYTYVDAYSAMALNLIAGQRARLGNANAPGNIGIFLNDLPAQNRLTVRDAQGQPLPGASVMVFRAAPMPGRWYGKYFDNVADMTLTADGQGQVLLGRNPFSTGAVVHTFGHANGVLILRVEHQGKIGYSFLEVWRFNMEYWRGKTALGEYSLSVALR